MCVCSLFKVFFFFSFSSFTTFNPSSLSISFFILFFASCSAPRISLLLLHPMYSYVFSPGNLKLIFFLNPLAAARVYVFVFARSLPTRFPIRGSWFAAPFPNAGTGWQWRMNGAQRGSFAGVVWTGGASCKIDIYTQTNYFPREIGPRVPPFCFPLSI